ncbi:hypothetical protein [Fusobacterium sp.]|uniref:hypothetical protein n=1 Tax=Fusobacterium sp. TaxID=68766 RepID=UPI00261B0BC8|nr:hypothetical protein [Fusobacterium sp.]
MKLKKNLLNSKKFLIFLFMIFSYVISYSTPSYLTIKENTKQNFILEKNSYDSIKYYVVSEKVNTIIFFNENKYETDYIPLKVRDIFLNKDCNDEEKINFKPITLKLYDIATDITRSMRN